MNKNFLIISSVLLAGAVIVFIAWNQANKNNNTNNAANENVQSFVTKTFTSTNLGIRFQYAESVDNESVQVQEIGDKVYVYLEGQQPLEGQSVQVWDKDSTTTLEQAIKAKFLVGYDPEKCYVDTEQALAKKVKTGIAAVINYPPSQTVGAPWWETGQNCPDGYTLTNAQAFFWTSQQSATHFVYFELEAPFIPGPDAATSWAETLEFI